MTNNIIEGEYLTPRQKSRLQYLRRLTLPLPNICPECDSPLEIIDEETICTCCGLVTSASIEYCAGVKINLPYGRH